ncbi:MAG: OmpA family protein [Verrucomicrobia bacterium]|nr:OmpA family protein [Verrucomicrobiota bacterium]MDE3047036.1 OmpA family protein [Verrucomicrobiota bacterium]
MKRFVTALLFLVTSCAHNSSETWENMKTAGRYMKRGVDSVLGKEHDSKMLSSEDEFYGPYDDDFIPLADADLRNQFSDTALPAPKGSPGQFGIPNLDNFYAPPEALKSVFCAIHFNTDEHVIRDRNEIATLTHLAEYLKKHPTVYVVVEGHCDERASASYNMALGMRRANAVRSFLVKNGADLNRIYTLSRGKEQPLALGHGQEDWRLNRRAEFRIHQK